MPGRKMQDTDDVEASDAASPAVPTANLVVTLSLIPCPYPSRQSLLSTCNYY